MQLLHLILRKIITNIKIYAIHGISNYENINISFNATSIKYNFKDNKNILNLQRIQYNMPVYTLSGIIITQSQKKYKIKTKYANDKYVKLSNITYQSNDISKALTNLKSTFLNAYKNFTIANIQGQIPTATTDENALKQAEDNLAYWTRVYNDGGGEHNNDQVAKNMYRAAVQEVAAIKNRDTLTSTSRVYWITKYTMAKNKLSVKFPDLYMYLNLTYQVVKPQIVIQQLTPQEAAQLDTSNIVTPTAVSKINSQHSQIIKNNTSSQTQVLSQQEIKTDGESQAPQSDVLSTLLNKSTVKSSFPPTPRAVIAYVPRERFVGLEAFPQKQKK